MNECGQVDLTNMQTMKDGSYRSILHYIECLTKCHVICSLKSKTPAELTHEPLMLFLDFGAPHIFSQTVSRNLPYNDTRVIIIMARACLG